MDLFPRLRRAYRSLHRIFVRGNALHPFDKRHGVDTSGLYYADELPTGHPHDTHSEGYYATAPSLFEGILQLWQTTLPNTTNPGAPSLRSDIAQEWECTNSSPLSRYHFVDLGCGKGRVLLLASQHPFRSITGIELHPDLARTARANVARWLRCPRACNNITVLSGDVLSVPLPDGPLVLFLFNAFAAEVMRALVQRLRAEAQDRPIHLLYLHPDQHAILRDTPGVRVRADADISFSEEDARADAFRVTTDRCTIYRISSPTHFS